MKKITFITLCLILLITGCDNKMDLIKKHITNLTQSLDIVSEKNNAEMLNNFSLDNNISYSLDITNNNNIAVNISDLEKNMNKKLHINIKVGEVTLIWTPVDNKNIYILLRE